MSIAHTPKVSARHRAYACLALGLTVAAGGCSLRSPRYNPSFNAYMGGGGYGYQQPGYGQPGYAQPQPGYPQATARPVAGGGNAMALLSSADQTLRAQGYSPTRQVYRQAINTGGLRAFPVQAQPGACYAVLAIGDAGVNDIDMTVIAPSGNVIGEDREPDAHPAVTFCATEYGMHLARVNMFSGAGQVLYVVYQGPPGTSADLTAAWGGGGGAPVARAPTTVDPNTGARIQAFNAQMQATGYTGSAPVGLSLQQGQEQSWQVNLQAGTCYSFATFGGPGVRDSDVFLFDASGSRRVAGDAGTAVDAAIRDICPTVTGPHQLRARLYSGVGPVWIAAYARRGAGAPATGGATQVNIASGGTSASGGLELFYRRTDRDLQSRGWATMTSSVNGTLTTGQEREEQAQLDAGSCYAIAAVGDSGIQDLDLFLLDAGGNEIDRDHAQDARPVVRVCPATSGRFTIRLRASAGAGDYRAGLYRWSSGTSGAGMSGILFVRNAELTRVLSADGYEGDANFEIHRARINEGASVTRNVTLQAGQCYAFVAVGGGGVSDLDITVTRGRENVAEDTTPTAFPAARHCATQGGAHRVTVRSVVGSGEFVFRVFRRSASGDGG